MSQSSVRWARARLRAALALGIVCAIAALVLLDPTAFDAAPARATPLCTQVQNTGDSGVGSLRAAVACVASGGTVTFNAALAGQTILLTTTEIVVTQTNITINGSTAPGIKVDGNLAHRVFNASAPLTINSLTIQNGKVAGFGGGLLGTSALNLSNVNFLSNTASSNGGGLWAGSTAAMNGGLLQNNISTGGGFGGAMYASGVLVLTGTQFVSNSTSSVGGALFAGDVATLNGALFQGNRSTGSDGGGVYASSSLVLSGTQFLSNTSSTLGGGVRGAFGVTVNGGLFQGNSSITSYGGGLYTAGAVVLTGTQFLSNTSVAPGGGLFAGGASTLNGALFENNQCTAPGCLGGGWIAGSSLNLTQFITTGDNIENDGPTSQAAGGIILFNGSSRQTIAGFGSTTFNDLWLANTGAGVWLGQDITVTDRLTLTSDLTTTGSYTLNLTASETAGGSGDVWGRSVRKHAFGIGTPYPFGNPNVSVTFNSGSAPTEMTVDLTHTVPTGANFGNAVLRYYDIWQLGGSGFAATLRLHYQDAELNGNTEGQLKIWHYANGAFTSYPVSNFDTTANWVESTGITSFSPWVISQNPPAGPTAVRLEAFDARAANPDSAFTALGLGAAGVLLSVGIAAALLRLKRR